MLSPLGHFVRVESKPVRASFQRPTSSIGAVLDVIQARVSTPMARPMPRKHAGALLMPELVKRAAVGAVSAARPQPGGRRQHPQSPGTAAADANSVGASQQAGAELLTWLNSAVPVNASAGSAGKGGAEPAAAATSPHAAAAAPADGTQLRRPVSDSHLWVRSHDRVLHITVFPLTQLSARRPESVPSGHAFKGLTNCPTFLPKSRPTAGFALRNAYPQQPMPDVSTSE